MFVSHLLHLQTETVNNICFTSIVNVFLNSGNFFMIKNKHNTWARFWIWAALGAGFNESEGKTIPDRFHIDSTLPVVRGFIQGFDATIRGGFPKMTLVAWGLASGSRGSIGTRISAGKVFKTQFFAIYE